MKSIHALMLDDEHDQGFINSNEIDIINTTHVNFENANIQEKLGLMLEESTPCHHLTYLS
jgi:hypothetical protein